MEESVQFCEYGNRCNGCPMIGQPRDVLDALNTAVLKVGDRSSMPGEAARAAVRAMYEAGFVRPLVTVQSQAITRAVERIAVRTTKNGQCPVYDATTSQHAQNPGNGEET